MIKKEKRLIFTFSVSVNAMRAEEEARLRGLPGRIIPVPGSVGAGCGLCYMVSPKDGEAIASMLRTLGIPWEREVEVTL